MKNLRLLDKANLSIYYDADLSHYISEGLNPPAVTKEAFISIFKSFPSRGFELNGVEFGGLIFDGKEVHFAVLPDYQGKWAFLLKPALLWLFSQQKILDVRVDVLHEKAVRLWDRVGLLRVASDNKSVTFRFCNHPDLFFNRRLTRL